MRILLSLFVVILFAAALASADPAPPELADEVLVLRWQRDATRVQAAENALAVAQRDLEQLKQAAEKSRAAIVAHHKLDLTAGDDINAETRVIKRAPKPEPKPAPKKDVKK